MKDRESAGQSALFDHKGNSKFWFVPLKNIIPSHKVLKIFFSKNEKFFVVITENQAHVLEITQTKFVPRGHLWLPTVKNEKEDISQAEPTVKFEKRETTSALWGGSSSEPTPAITPRPSTPVDKKEKPKEAEAEVDNP
jgi:hypothetical protein